MDFSLSEEQILLRESVQKYVADHGGVEAPEQAAEIGIEASKISTSPERKPEPPRWNQSEAARHHTTSPGRGSGNR